MDKALGQTGGTFWGGLPAQQQITTTGNATFADIAAYAGVTVADLIVWNWPGMALSPQDQLTAAATYAPVNPQDGFYLNISDPLAPANFMSAPVRRDNIIEIDMPRTAQALGHPPVNTGKARTLSVTQDQITNTLQRAMQIPALPPELTALGLVQTGDLSNTGSKYIPGHMVQYTATDESGKMRQTCAMPVFKLSPLPYTALPGEDVVALARRVQQALSPNLDGVHPEDIAQKIIADNNLPCGPDGQALPLAPGQEVHIDIGMPDGALDRLLEAFDALISDLSPEVVSALKTLGLSLLAVTIAFAACPPAGLALLESLLLGAGIVIGAAQISGLMGMFYDVATTGFSDDHIRELAKEQQSNFVGIAVTAATVGVGRSWAKADKAFHNRGRHVMTLTSEELMAAKYASDPVAKNIFMNVRNDALSHASTDDIIAQYGHVIGPKIAAARPTIAQFADRPVSELSRLFLLYAQPGNRGAQLDPGSADKAFGIRVLMEAKGVDPAKVISVPVGP